MTSKLLILSTLILLLSACDSDDNTIRTEDPTVEATETATINDDVATVTDDTAPTVTETEEPVVVVDNNTPAEAEPNVPDENLLSGVFLDSAVEGLNYTTATQNGKTNEFGEFNFLADESITFSIGGIEFPATPAMSYLTPLSLYQTDDINQIEVVNLVRLLQTLDTDGDASNGITISDAVHTLAEDLTLDFDAIDFEQQVSSLVSLSGAATQTLISADDALAHFQLTLDDINNTGMTSCTTDNAKVGHSGFFSTLAHNVSGKATIIDDCTIEISEFIYDGDGPAVYFYGALDHAYESSDAFEIGPLLTRDDEYNNESFQITLPQGKSLDDLTGLSVWCVDFNANFGEMEFTP